MDPRQWRIAAQWTGAHKGHAFFAYATNYLIDTDHGVIVDVEATRAIRQAEVGASRTMVDRTEERFGPKPGYLVADTAYGSADNLAWLVKQKRITPYIPVFDKSTRTDGTFSRSDFTFDPEADCYTCPAGKKLVQFRRAYATPRTGVAADGTRRYRASKKDCDVCELKARCCPNGMHPAWAAGDDFRLRQAPARDFKSLWTSISSTRVSMPKSVNARTPSSPTP